MTEKRYSADGEAAVRQGYDRIGRDGVWTRDAEGGGESCCGAGGCCGPAMGADALAEEIGYDREELEALPEAVNLGLSCGNPGAVAALQSGEVVLDLGCGAGFDVFLCAPKVGNGGRVIGVDMTPSMLERARRNAVSYAERTGRTHVEFRLGEIEHLPVADQSVDVVISNCVLNLSQQKDQVWREMARVLRPGGRVAVSDIALWKPLPEGVQALAEAWIGCVAGAVPMDEMERLAGDAGLAEVVLAPKPEYVRAMMDSGDPLYVRIEEALPEGEGPADYISSVEVRARKP